MPPRSKYDFHCPDKVKYSILRPNNKSTRARIEESPKYDESVVSHTTNVLELECPEYQWHILPYPLKNKCQALEANTWHPWKAKVEKSKHGTLAPTYKGLEKECCSNNHIPTNFWFCRDDINQHMKGSKKK